MSEAGRKRSLVQVIRSATSLVWKSARRDFIQMTATQVVSALALAAELYLAREVLTEITNKGGFDSFDVLGPVLIMLGLVRLVLAGMSILRSELRLVAYERVHRAAAHEMLRVAVAVDLADYDAADFHDRLNRAYDNITSRIWNSVWSIVEIASAVATLVTLLVVLVLIAPLVLAFALVGALPMWWARRKNNLALYRLSYDYTAEDRERQYLERLLIDREAAGELRAADLGPRLIGRIDLLFVRRIDRMRVLVRQRLRWSVGAVAISNFMAMGALALLAHLIIEGTISVADGGVALLALQQAAYRISTVSASVASLSGAALFLDDYEDFVRQPLPPQATDPIRPEDLTGVRFENVTFSYPGTEAKVLRGVHLEIRRGELVALVGVNGSGKSTIAKLLAGLYDVDDGAVVWETTHGPVVDRHRIHPAIGLVFQHSLRFELSAEDNVSFGDSRSGDMADRDRVWAALQAAGIAAVIESSGVGLDVRLGRTFAGGMELSAGQWQRVGIARAFYRDAPLLVLDEPTAAVDARAEEELFRVVRKLQQGRGVLLITHRMATVREADRIYVMSEGQVVERGSHDELMAEHGQYADLYDIQARAYRDAQ